MIHFGSCIPRYNNNKERTMHLSDLLAAVPAVLATTELHMLLTGSPDQREGHPNQAAKGLEACRTIAAPAGAGEPFSTYDPAKDRCVIRVPARLVR
jgi:hypothetical protein